MNKWVFFTQGASAGLLLGLTCTYFDQKPADGWVAIVAVLGLIGSIATTYYSKD